jgi:hypothetical protein
MALRKKKPNVRQKNMLNTALRDAGERLRLYAQRHQLAFFLFHFSFFIIFQEEAFISFL